MLADSRFRPESTGHACRRGADSSGRASSSWCAEGGALSLEQNESLHGGRLRCGRTQEVDTARERTTPVVDPLPDHGMGARTERPDEELANALATRIVDGDVGRARAGH